MPPGGPESSRPAGVIPALAVYTTLAAVVLAPALGDPSRRTVGSPANDVWNHLWGHRWVYRSIEAGELPVHTDLLGWPTGGALWYIDTLGAVLSAPVQALLGPVAAYNATLAGNLVFSALAADLLARRIGAGPRGALVAGVSFALTPHVLAQIYNGVSEATATGWMPLALALALGAWRAGSVGRSVRQGLLAGLAWGMGAVASAYVGVWTGLALLLLIAFERPSRWAATAATMVGAAAAVAAGPAALFARTLAAPDALVRRDPAFVWSTLVDHNQTDLHALVRPFDWYSPDLRALFHEDLIIVVYAGAALWVPALAVVAAEVRRRAARGAGELRAGSSLPWAVIAAGFAVLSLGPFLYVDGALVEVDGGRVPLPYHALFRWVPGFTAVSHPYRFAVGTSLGLSMVAALGVARLEAWRPALGWPVAIAWAAARAGEALLASPAVWPLPVVTLEVAPANAVIDALERDDARIGEPGRTARSSAAFELATMFASGDGAGRAGAAWRPGADDNGASDAEKGRDETGARARIGEPPAAVLDLPLSLGPLERSAPLVAQLTAGDRPHPVPFGLNDPLPDWLAANRYTRMIAELERRRSLRLPAELPLLDLAVGAHDLRARGLRWIVVHRDIYGEEAWARVRPLLELTATLRHDGGEVVVYELGEGEPQRGR